MNKHDFLKSIRLAITDSLYEEIAILVKAEEISSNHTLTSKSYDISTIIANKRTMVNELYKENLITDFLKPLEEINNNLEVDPDEINQEE